MNSTSSFIASYTELSTAGGNGTGGVITTYVPSLSFLPISVFPRCIQFPTYLPPSSLSSSHPFPSHKTFIHVRPLCIMTSFIYQNHIPHPFSQKCYITSQAIELTCRPSHQVLRHLHRQLGSREERLEDQGQDIRD